VSDQELTSRFDQSFTIAEHALHFQHIELNINSHPRDTRFVLFSFPRPEGLLKDILCEREGGHHKTESQDWCALFDEATMKAIRHVFRDIDYLENNIEHILSGWESPPKRNRRGGFDAVGSAVGSLLGLVTEDELSKIQGFVERAGKYQTSINHLIARRVGWCTHLWK